MRLSTGWERWIVMRGWYSIRSRTRETKVSHIPRKEEGRVGIDVVEDRSVDEDVGI